MKPLKKWSTANAPDVVTKSILTTDSANIAVRNYKKNEVNIAVDSQRTQHIVSLQTLMKYDSNN